MASGISLLLSVLLSLPFLLSIVLIRPGIAFAPLSIEEFRQMTAQALLGFFVRSILAVFLLGLIVNEFASASC
jgi:hypothetical protein